MDHEFLGNSGIGMLPGLLLPWYDRTRRRLPWREEIVPYHTWLSEIMLQQTRVEAVLPYYHRFLKELPDIFSLANASEEQIHKLWEGLGYYSRVRNMQKAARVICQEYGGQLPSEEQALKKLPGIGDYTAGAIASIAFGQPAPAVDGNVLRVLSRFLAFGEDVMLPAVRRWFQDVVRMILPPDRPGDFNQALMELGAMVCLPNGAPLCGKCPLNGCCRGKEQGNPEAYPVKSPKKARKLLPRTVIFFCWKDRLFFNKRPEKGLLARLWEPFSLEGHFSDVELLTVLERRGIFPLILRPLGTARHIFTHLEWEMQGYWAQVEKMTPLLETGKWISWDQLKETHTVPSAFRPFMKKLKKEDFADAIRPSV